MIRIALKLTTAAAVALAAACASGTPTEPGAPALRPPSEPTWQQPAPTTTPDATPIGGNR